MILRSCVRETGCKVADNVLLSMDSNRDPVRYRENFVIINNNDSTSSSRAMEDDSCKVSDGSFYHMFCCELKRWGFQERFVFSRQSS